MNTAEIIVTVLVVGLAQSITIGLFVAGRLGKRLDGIDGRMATQSERMGQMTAEVAVLRTHVDYLRPVHHRGDERER